jgi:HTH-type transcriptional regulator/antitoxin HigA
MEGATLMPSTKTGQYHGPPADTYARLVSVLPPRPLHDKVDYENAVEMLGNLVGYDLNQDQEDYLIALDTFVQRYEAEHDETQVDIPRISSLDTLRSILREANMTGADLSRLLGASRTLGPMILRGERKITADHARRLGEYFKLDPGIFIR